MPCGAHVVVAVVLMRKWGLSACRVPLSAAGDRGGVSELIDTIKRSRIPIICICNDKYNQKLRSLRNHCLELEFRKPTEPQIAARLQTVCAAEQLTINQVTQQGRGRDAWLSPVPASCVAAAAYWGATAHWPGRPGEGLRSIEAQLSSPTWSLCRGCRVARRPPGHHERAYQRRGQRHPPGAGAAADAAPPGLAPQLRRRKAAIPRPPSCPSIHLPPAASPLPLPALTPTHPTRPHPPITTGPQRPPGRQQGHRHEPL
jgi:hypothetical protein